MLSNPALFREGLVWRNSPILHDFCLICNFYTVDKVLRLSFRSLFRQLSFLFVDSVKAGGFRQPSILRCMHGKYSPKVMPLLRSFPPLSEHNLRHVQLRKVEVERVTDVHRDSWSKNNRSRMSSTFIKVDLIDLSKIITYSENDTEVVGWTDEIHHHFTDESSALKCMFAPHFFNPPFWKFLHLSRIGCFCTRYTSVTCFACSSHFPFGLSGYLIKVQRFLENLDQCTWIIRAYSSGSKLHFFPRLAETTLYLLLVPVKTSAFRSSIPRESLDGRRFLM